ncbi:MULTISPECIES: argininosuccinate lyase [Halolamina]|uniref:Argininosuccinate lyase n=1 Tax=Halolamina pelagica TaxID=699431 RepID=A0A1I5P5G4_9EURY|nr:MULTISPECIES: argininosuccinate lyase [Halolamina]NHX36614.1 argininosuccinate lyase [Halolamina sp. R1-12]SFP28726.1 argininosuccinate lyase [Halolamina pelagica]
MTGDDPSGTAETVVRRERFAGGPARSFMSSLDADQRIFAADLAVDRAHVVMLAEQGIVGDDDAGAILGALDTVAEAGHEALPEGEDVHEAIESAVVEEVGPAGGKMHTARSRNDEVATCIRYRFRQDLLDAAEATIELRGTLLDAAAAETGTVVPGFTHRQHAQPTTVGHLLASYAGAVARDTERLLAAYERTNRSPLGSAAFAGTTFDVDRERTADLLGFHDVIENAADAVTARDFLVEGCGAFAALSATLSGLATDLIEGAKDGHVDLDDAYASTSSIMPQKKNPDSLELVRAVAGDAVGDLTGLLSTLKGLPRAYNRDLQRATPHAWDAVDIVTEATEVTAGAVATAEWDADACAADAGAGFSTATGVADALAVAGLPFRSAHELVAEAATDLDDAEMAETDAQIDALETAAAAVLDDSLATYVDRETLEDLLSPAGSVAARDSQGGPAASAVEASLTRMRETHADHAAAVDANREALAAADDRLASEVSEYV